MGFGVPPDAGSAVACNSCRPTSSSVPTVGSVVAKSGASPAGGAETQTLLLAKALTGRGYRVAVVAFGDPAGLHVQVDGVHILPRLPYHSRGGVTGGIIEALRIWQSL